MRAVQWLLLGFAGVLQVATAFGQSADASKDKALSLTVYNKDLALIEHVRAVNVPAGKHRIEFKGVSARIVPQTVGFGGQGLQLIEQNFDYDLLTPENLMEKAVGQNVRIVRTNPGTGNETSETAEVLSTQGGVVLRIGNRIEVLRDDGIPARVIFDKVPENLRANPTLSVLANAAKPVSGDIKLTYLSRGLSWSSDYVATFDEKAGEVAVQGWITLTNQSGTSFENARVQLVAGDINIVGSEQEWFQLWNQRRQSASARRAAGTETTTREQLADYYVYPIAGLTTVANQQIKQVSFLTAEKVKASKGYEQTYYGFDSSDEPQNAEVRVRFANSKAAGLGEQLPSGVVRVYARDARGQPQFVGEDRIGHTSAGSELALKIGEAFDVTVQPTLESTNRISRRNAEYSMSYLVRNARSSPVTVTIRQRGLWRFNEVTEESIKGRRTDADSFAWDVPVSANGEATLKVTIRQWW
ncbi:MAG TPA: DUF4139 domain-containing protein [Steroidobacteraceae bacterium]|jgi:hypothetical protein|nr:DUF4139 domain-containing protein [Steroidobacteraceae bacterium]